MFIILWWSLGFWATTALPLPYKISTNLNLTSMDTKEILKGTLKIALAIFSLGLATKVGKKGIENLKNSKVRINGKQ